jgi:CheY-like chemotaxis protein
MPRILIVEDEPTVRDLLCTILNSSYECVAVRSAEELALLSESDFDAAVTDVNLPGMGGEEFLKAAVGLRPGLPVIVMTGADADEAKFIEAGAAGYLLKPFRIEELAALLEQAART